LKINREDVVQAALVVERYCKEHFRSQSDCYDCPFVSSERPGYCALCKEGFPFCKNLERFLLKRGLEK